MTAPTTLYSIRDALGQELWWTTSRKNALRLVAELNVAGVGAMIFKRAVGQPYAGVRAVYNDTLQQVGAGLRAHQLPVAAFKLTRVKERFANATNQER